MCTMKMQEPEILALTNAIVGIMLVISELLGMSACKSNSILEYCYNKFICSSQQECNNHS